MRRRLKPLLARLARLLAMLVILFAAATLALRALLPQADGLREELATHLSRMLGVQVQVGALSVRLRGLSPQLTLNDAALLDPLNGAPLLGLKALVIDLDLGASLVARAPRIEGVTLVGAEIEVRRRADGRIGILGLDALHGDADAAALDFFLGEGRFSLSDSTLYWTDSFAGVPALAVVVERLDFVNEGKRHRIRLEGRPPGDRNGRLLVLARLDGPPGRPADWSGPLYLDWQGSDIARLLRWRLPAMLKLSSEGLAVQGWVTLARGHVGEALADLRFQDLTVRRIDPAGVLHIGDVTGLARWRAGADGWRLEVADLTAFGSPWHRERTGAALILRRPAGPEGGRRVLASIDSLPLKPLAGLAALFPEALPAPLDQIVRQRIAGRLQGLSGRLDLAADSGAAADWRLRGRVQGLGVPAAGAVPAVDNLSLDVDTGPDHGWIGLDAADTTIDLRPWLAAPTNFTRLEGTLGWRRMPAGSIHLWTATALAADTADVGSVSRLSLCLPPSGLAPFIDLQSHFTDGDGTAAHRYLPVAVMDDKLVDWLDRAIVSGHLTSGDLVLRGPLDRFPFDDQSGRFILELRVRDGILDYAPPRPISAGARTGIGERERAKALGWPRLEEMDALLRFDDRSLDIEVASAKLLGAEVTTGSARLPDLWNPRRLHIHAEGAGPLSDGLRVLAETPLSAGLGGIPRTMTASGRGGLVLDLGLPLEQGLDMRLAGRVLFDAADEPAVTLAGTDLRLTGLDGKLAFDDAGLHADGIRADLDGQSLRIDIDTAGGDAGGGKTTVGFRGETPVAELARRFPNRFWALAGGRLDWRLDAVIDNADAGVADPPLGLRFSSKLNGLALDLPQPLGKEAGTTLPLVIAGRVGGGGAGTPAGGAAASDGLWPLALAVRFGGNGARLELDRDADGRIGVTRAAVEAGGLPRRLPEPRGILVGGGLDALDLGPWLAWSRDHAALFDPAGGTADATPAPPVLPSRLDVRKLTLGNLALRDVDARFAPTAAGGWSLRFESAGNDGSVELPPRDSDAGIAVHLASLDLAGLGGGQAAEAAEAGDGDPRRFGRLDLSIDDLRAGEAQLGRLHLVTEPVPAGLRLAELGLDGALLDVTGSGEWTIDGTDFEQTRIEIDASSDDLGRLLNRLDYYSELGEAPAKAATTLAWPGGPAAFSLTDVRGHLDVTVGAGRLLQVDPGVGRMLGVLNLGALRRRLSLDFSDVFDKGFGFDTIDGQLLIGSGQARIGNLEIAAAPADIRITGSADLVNETFDQTVQVTPKIGTGVALASAVAGGPLVGAAVFLADKVAGDAVDRLARYEYRITGPWRDPTIVRTGSTLLGAGNTAPGTGNETPGAGEPPPIPAGDDSGTPAGGGADTGSARPVPTAPRDDNPFLEGF